MVGPGDAIELGPGVGRVDPEAELTLVIGSRARGLTPGNAMGAVLGYTIGNDVSARDLQESDELWISAKSQDTFTPAGPWIVTDLNGANLAIGITHNGANSRRPARLIWAGGVEEILVYLTSFMTLHPGDLVLTGFPAECARIRPRRHRHLPRRRNRGAHEPRRGRRLSSSPAPTAPAPGSPAVAADAATPDIMMVTVQLNEQQFERRLRHARDT